MTNAISKSRLAATTSTTRPTDEQIAQLDLTDADQLVVEAFSNLETAARVYKREKLTQPQMVERLATLGIKCSARSIQRVFADLRQAQDPEFQASQHPEAVKKRKQREKGTNRQIGEMSPTDDSHSSPPNFFLSSDTSFNDQSNDEPGDTELRECEVVSDFQSEMGTSYHGRSKGVVPMDTTNNGAADEEYDEVLNLIDRIKTISSRHYRPNQPGTWTEHQWLNLTELYFTMHSIAEGYSRDYKQERRDYADQCVKQVATFFDTTDGSSSNRIGGNA